MNIDFRDTKKVVRCADWDLGLSIGHNRSKYRNINLLYQEAKIGLGNSRMQGVSIVAEFVLAVSSVF